MTTTTTRARRDVSAFLSYAHADRRLVDRFRRLLMPRLGIDKAVAYRLWWDQDIVAGELWDDEIVAALGKAEVGLLLLSPAFFSRPYITSVELPRLVNDPDKIVIPVGLQRVDFARTDMRGLERRQVFRYQGPRHDEPQFFADLRGENPARFCDELARELWRRLAARGA